MDNLNVANSKGRKYPFPKLFLNNFPENLKILNKFIWSSSLYICFDFLSPVWDRLFKLINNHPLTLERPRGPLNGVNEFTLSNPDAFTDQALLGTIKIDQPNPEYARGADNVDFEGNPIPELIDVPIAGALFCSGIILIMFPLTSPRHLT